MSETRPEGINVSTWINGSNNQFERDADHHRRPHAAPRRRSDPARRSDGQATVNFAGG
ncbi:MAG: hypothetical protein U0326_40775 [Polyangiales bacterium]